MDSEELLAALFARLGIALLVRCDSGLFRVVAPVPEWFSLIYPTAGETVDVAKLSPFLENFLVDAAEFWGQTSTERLLSGPWTESAPDGEDVVLAAVAMSIQGTDVVTIERAQSDGRPMATTLQTAREVHLRHDRLTAEILKREILLNWIVHDLRQPLTGISAALSMLAFEQLSIDQQQLVDICVAQLSRIDVLVQDILQRFAPETDAVEPQTGAAPRADMFDCALRAIQRLAQAFAQANVRIDIDQGVDRGLDWSVQGAPTHVEHVVWNLLANALKNSPSQSKVMVSLVDAGDHIRINVDDEGTRSPSETGPRLFERVPITREQSTDSASHGLYISRLTCERLGGDIGYERLSSGSRIWARLPR